MSESVASIHKAGIEIAASTTTANAAFPAGDNSAFVRIVNGTNGIAYVNAGADNTVTATAANIAVRPQGEAIFGRNPNTDAYLAVILSAGATSGKVSASLVGI